MAFEDPQSGAAASTFLALYVIFTGFSSFVLYRKGWKSLYTFLFIFGLLRVGAQLSAVAFSAIGYDGINWLIAYLILGAEGYFTLILASMYFFCSAETDKYGESWFRPTEKQMRKKARDTGKSYGLIRYTTPAAIFHWILIPANALIVSGGSLLAGVDPDEKAQYQSKLNTAKGLRAAGQAVFLFQNIVIGFLGFYLLFWRHVRGYKMTAVFAAWPFLLIRGIFGLLSVFISSLNYFDISNYTSSGLSTKFLACEYVLGATMEYVAASLILSTYYIKNDNKHGDRDRDHEMDVDDEPVSKF